MERLPDTVMERLPDTAVLGSADRAVLYLVNKHAGEVVEMDRTKMSWVLHSLGPGSASVQWSERWNCKEDGRRSLKELVSIIL